MLLVCQAPLPHAAPVAVVAVPFIVVVARASLSMSVPPWSCPRPAGGDAGPILAPHAARGRPGHREPATGEADPHPRGSTGARDSPSRGGNGHGAGRIAAPSLVSPAILGVKRRGSRRPTRRLARVAAQIRAQSPRRKLVVDRW